MYEKGNIMALASRIYKYICYKITLGKLQEVAM
jgi:hypothetical protein